MNRPTFLDRLNFLRAVPTLSIEAHDTDIVLSNEILALSQAAEDAIWPLLHTSPDGLEPAEVEARLALVGPNLITREGHPSIVRELWARAKNPLNALLLSLAVIFYFLGDVRAAVVISVIALSAYFELKQPPPSDAMLAASEPP
jgi:P-type Mg2+ transporter